MYDARRAVEVIARSGPGKSDGYGSGYRIGGDLVLTCAHIFPEDLTGLMLSLRDTIGRRSGATVVWRNRTADIALLSEDRVISNDPVESSSDPSHAPLSTDGILPPPPAVIAELPALTGGESLNFVMFGWPRAGDVRDEDSGQQIREPVQIDGEIKLAEYMAAKSGLLRLRPREQYPALSRGSYWTGMSGAAVFCADCVVAIQTQQPYKELPGYLAAQPLTRPMLDYIDAGVSAADLLTAAGVRFGNVLPYRSSPPTRGYAGLRAHAVRPYLLLETDQLIGRIDLRAIVNDFLTGPDNDARVLVLFGLGGSGKSAIAWDAWRHLRRQGERRQFWYSFYDGKGSGSFQSMLDELARFLDLGAVRDQARVSVEDVLDELHDQEVTLFLDGIERCLHCYQRRLGSGDLEVIRISDDVSGPWSEHELGFADVNALSFFLQLTEVVSCKIVATSRLIPAEFFTSGGILRAGIATQLVEDLEPGDASAFMDAIGLGLTPALVVEVVAVFGGHPLALQLLARLSYTASLNGREPGQWLVDKGYLNAAGRGATSVRTQLFSRAAASVSVDAQLTLAITGALGGAMSIDVLRRLVWHESVHDEHVARIILEITSSGLGRRSENGMLACHPIMASAAVESLSPERTKQLASALESELGSRFDPIPQPSGVPGPITPLGPLDIAPSYATWASSRQADNRSEALALCHALIRLRQWEEATRLYDEQLRLPIRKAIGANFEAVEVLKALETGWIAQEADQTRTNALDFIREELAHHLLMTGHLRKAGELAATVTEVAPLYCSALLTSAEADLHLGEYDRSLGVAGKMLHRARIEIDNAWTKRARFSFEVSIFEVWGHDYNIMLDPVSHFIEAAAVGVRILLAMRRQAEAAMLLQEARRVRRVLHGDCRGCLGQLLRSAAEVLLPEDAALALDVVAMGRGLQEEDGRLLDGLLSDVLVSAATVDPEEDRRGESRTGWSDLPSFLGSGGFVLYQLFLESALNGSRSANQSEQGRRLSGLEARYLLSHLKGHQDNQSSGLHDDTIAGYVGWLIEGRAIYTFADQEGRQSSGGIADVDSDEDFPEAEQGVIDRAHAALNTIIDSAYPEELLREVGQLVQDGPPGPAFGDAFSFRSTRTAEVWSLLPARYRWRARACLAAGDDIGRRLALQSAVTEDPCDAESMAELAELAQRAGDVAVADSYRAQLKHIVDYKVFRRLTDAAGGRSPD